MKTKILLCFLCLQTDPKKKKKKRKVERKNRPTKIDEQGIPTNKWYRRIKQDWRLSSRIEMEKLLDNEDNNGIGLFIGRHGTENEASQCLIPQVIRWRVISPVRKRLFPLFMTRIYDSFATCQPSRRLIDWGEIDEENFGPTLERDN